MLTNNTEQKQSKSQAEHDTTLKDKMNKKKAKHWYGLK